MLDGLLISVADDVSVPRRSQSHHRIPIVFLGACAPEEEQSVPIRVTAFQFPPKPVSKKSLPGRRLSSARMPLQLTWNK